MPAAIHPADAALAAFSRDSLPAAEAEVVRRHLDGCESCRRRLAGNETRPTGGTDLNGGLSQAVRNLADLPTVDHLPDELTGLTQYADLKELGRGGMGVVYLARHALLDRPVVLKVASRELLAKAGGDTAERFLREMRSAAKLSHPNVVAAYDALRHGDVLVFVMEYAHGEDLAKVLARKGPLPVPTACFYAHCVALGLQHAHSHGLVHRDIKPANLIQVKTGTKAVVKVLDFGLAKVSREAGGSGPTVTNMGMGTPQYMAPEQWRDAGGVDIRADIYSLGCTLFCLLMGKPPFRGNQYELMVSHCDTPPPAVCDLRPDVSAELSVVVAKMLAKNPADRFQTPAEVAAELRPFIRPAAKSGEGPQPQPPRRVTTLHESATQPTITTPPASRRRRVWPTAAAGVVAVTLLAMAGGVFKTKTPHGTLVIENVPADAEVVFDGATSTVTRNGETVTLTATQGKHSLTVKKGGVVLSVDGGAEVTVGGQPVRVRVEPLSKPAETPMPTEPSAMSNQPAKPSPPTQPGSVSSRFGPGNADGWIVRQGEETDYPAVAAKPSEWQGVWAIRGEDTERGPHWGWQAPAKYHGDQSRQFGRELTYRLFLSDVAQNKASGAPIFRRAVVLSGAGKTLTLDSPKPQPTAGQWLTRRVSLDASAGWTVSEGGSGGRPATDADLRAVLAAVTNLWIKGEYSLGVDFGFVADVQFGVEPLRTDTTLPSPRPADSTPPEVGFTPLFNGRDLTGWTVEKAEQKAACWAVQDGAIVGTKPKDDRFWSYLLAEGEYADFALRFEFQFATSYALGAVAVRAVPGEAAPKRTNGNVPHHPRLDLAGPGRVNGPGTGNPIFLNGMFGGPPPTARPAVEVDRWHTAEVVIHGDICSMSVDGKSVVGLVADPQPAGGAYTRFRPGLLRKSGRVGLMALADTVRFRRVMIKRLDGNPPPPRPVKSDRPAAAVPDDADEVEPVVSRFAAGDADGWRVTGPGAGGRKQEVRAAGGNFWLWSSGEGGPSEKTLWGWEGPPKFRGDQADKYGRLITFRTWEEKPPKRGPNEVRVRLMGKGEGELFVPESAVRQQTAGGWTTFNIRLDPKGGWTNRFGGAATEQEFRTVLADLRSLWIGMGQSGNAAAGLDDVVLGAEN